ncbi:hypothetical protein QBC46DRAFT_82438 [Diplogelasinospora grovesii]|uniref:Ubiquitin carboxyl-terminal hydrolase n=1 Tax=Diplogelasinospora grovesii TaxID=303347 RepID=A0AAN6S6G1_9PEZI|nr:hypothetical protein QBC46DRAFT_82438 [Diplogelasinospora grovesii]
MAGFFNKIKVPGVGSSKADNSASSRNKKEEPAPELTPLEKILQNAGPIREDGSDKFFGLENFGNTCYCNSIVQALYYSESFRDNVVKYPPFTPADTPDGKPTKVNVSIRAPVQANGSAAGAAKGQPMKQRTAINAGAPPPGSQPVRPEDKPDTPEYKKKQAMLKGPVLELVQESPEAYGMQECTFTGLKDIFTALIESDARTGVLSPQRFLDIFKRDNENFRNSMHQDAHEFYGIVLNDVIANVEENARRMQQREESGNKDGLTQSVENVGGASTALQKWPGSGVGNGVRTPGTGWVHDIFEGVLVSETRCLTCETASQRDETFLDLSIDLEEHSSITSCLRKFSAEEMLCERNKFHCDHCGGLQEAEKRMKIKKLPQVMALHLKRFKYTEDFSRLQKLFHRVVYPYYLRMFNTTVDAEDPDRMYELYAVVVHIGGNAYHGHYVAIIKTKDRGWLLFDDEMVEPVDKSFVMNFFGDKPGMACAYVLFYQETTFEKMREEQDAEGLEEVRLASQQADLALGSEGVVNGTHPLSKLKSQPVSPVESHDALATLGHARTAPGEIPSSAPPPLPPLPTQAGEAKSGSYSHPLVAAPPPGSAVMTEADKAATVPPTAVVVVPAPPKSKEDKVKGKKEQKALEKARKLAEKEEAKAAEKERAERQAQLRERHKNEQEQLQKALQMSKQSAAEDEKRRKKAEAEAADGTLEGATNGSGEKSPAGFFQRLLPSSDATDGAGNSNNGERSPTMAFLNRANRGSKSMTRKSFAFLNKGDKADKDKDKENKDKRVEKDDKSDKDDKTESAIVAVDKTSHQQNADSSGHSPPRTPDRTAAEDVTSEMPPAKRMLKGRLSFGLGRKKSGKFLS